MEGTYWTSVQSSACHPWKDARDRMHQDWRSTSCPNAELAFWPHLVHIFINNLTEAAKDGFVENVYIIKLRKNGDTK